MFLEGAHWAAHKQVAFLALPVSNTEVRFLQQGKELVSGKNVKGISKMSLFFLPLDRSGR